MRDGASEGPRGEHRWGGGYGVWAKSGLSEMILMIHDSRKQDITAHYYFPSPLMHYSPLNPRNYAHRSLRFPQFHIPRKKLEASIMQCLPYCLPPFIMH